MNTAGLTQMPYHTTRIAQSLMHTQLYKHRHTHTKAYKRTQTHTQVFEYCANKASSFMSKDDTCTPNAAVSWVYKQRQTLSSLYIGPCTTPTVTHTLSPHLSLFIPPQSLHFSTTSLSLPPLSPPPLSLFDSTLSLCFFHSIPQLFLSPSFPLSLFT